MTSLTTKKSDFRSHCLARLADRYKLTESEAEEVLSTHEQQFKYEVGLEVVFKGCTVGSIVYKITTSAGRVFYPVRKYYPDLKRFVLITYLHPDQVAYTQRKMEQGTWSP